MAAIFGELAPIVNFFILPSKQPLNHCAHGFARAVAPKLPFVRGAGGECLVMRSLCRVAARADDAALPVLRLADN
jgi:hypothetical protein